MDVEDSGRLGDDAVGRPHRTSSEPPMTPRTRLDGQGHPWQLVGDSAAGGHKGCWLDQPGLSTPSPHGTCETHGGKWGDPDGWKKAGGWLLASCWAGPPPPLWGGGSAFKRALAEGNGQGKGADMGWGKAMDFLKLTRNSSLQRPKKGAG